MQTFKTTIERELSSKLKYMVGCWIDNAIPRSPREVTQKMIALAEELYIPTVTFLQELDEYSADDDDLYHEMMEEIDELINIAIMDHGYIALWEHGDYLILTDEDVDQDWINVFEDVDQE